MSKVHHLSVVTDKERAIREDTVNTLKAALRAAKKGEITECIVIARCPTDMPDGTRWREMASATTNFCEWIGRLRILETSWIEQYREFTEVDTSDEDQGDGEDSDE